MTLENHIPHISKHYCHAINKHPKFAARLFHETELLGVDWRLKKCRETIREQARGKYDVIAETLLLCEEYEVIEAYAKKDYAAAIEELYDTIAVLMRMVDFIEKENHNDHQS